MDKRVAIHQPNFFPWLGFFDKFLGSDIFILLDHVENNPRDASFFGRRVKLLINKQEYWFSLPLIKDKGKLGIPINRMQINLSNKREIMNKLVTIQQNYKKAPYYNEIIPYIEAYFSSESPFISERNIEFIRSICNKLDESIKIELSSNLEPLYSSSDLLIYLVKKVDGNSYYYGGLGNNYQEEEKFNNENIELVAQNFEYPKYKQFNSKHFVEGLSIIDSLMNLGFEGVKSLLINKKY